MRAVVARNGLLAAMAALAMASVAALVLYTSSANAQAEKFTLCHRTGSAQNPFNAITVDANSIPQAHEGHGDFILEGEQTEEDCAAADTTTTTSNPCPTTAGTTTGITTGTT